MAQIKKLPTRLSFYSLLYYEKVMLLINTMEIIDENNPFVPCPLSKKPVLDKNELGLNK